MRALPALRRYSFLWASLLLVGALLSPSWAQTTRVAPPRATTRAAGEKPAFSFAVVTDVHVSARDGTQVKHYDEALPRLKAAVADFNQRDLAFTIQLGDFTDVGMVKVDDALAAWNQCKAPHYNVIGNHDVKPADRNADKNEFKATVRKAYKLDTGYYDFAPKTDGAAWRMVVMDCMNESPQQTAWLGETLQKAVKQGEKVIVFRHYGSTGGFYREGVPPKGASAEMIKLMADSRCVVAYMSGHEHAASRRDVGGICCITFRAMVEGTEGSYGIVEVYRDHLEVVGTGSQPDVSVKFSTTAPVGK